ncbi:MAG: hypothetical protein C5B59_10110 [Bacteroidetes bacterium]|nr:MAG: hypothetical protein C5B59_10110 [Bacteroidota bacterium]
MIIRNLVVGLMAATAVNLTSTNPSFNRVHTQSADTLLAGTWYLQPVLPSDMASGSVASINFDLSRNSFTGSTGCNVMRGQFKRSGKGLMFNDQVVTTRMSCPGYNEANFLRNLLRTNSYRIEKGILILMVDNTELSRWTRKVTKPKKTDTV